MDIYEYIAASNPQAAENILSNFGYEMMNVESPTDLAECLEDLVGKEGDKALTEIVAVHPDKDLILEKFAGGSEGKTGGCGCGGLCKKTKKYLEKTPFASFAPSSTAQLLIISGTVLCTVALIMRS